MLGDITKRVNTEEFDDFVALPENYDRNFELIDGEIVEKMVSGPISSRLTGRLMVYLGSHIIVNDLGEITPPDGGYWVGDDRYIPDIAFISKAKLSIAAKQGYVMIFPDLAIEVISASDREKDITTKVANYLAAGTVLWMVDPKDQTVKVFEPSKPVVTFTRNMTLIGGNVLPDFSLNLALLFKATENQSG